MAGGWSLYRDWRSSRQKPGNSFADADAAMVTSYCPDALAAATLVFDIRALRVFYDLDSPVTLARLAAGDSVTYLGPDGLAPFDLVLSYAGGAAPRRLRRASAPATSRRSTAASTPSGIGPRRRPTAGARRSPIWGPMRPIGSRNWTGSFSNRRGGGAANGSSSAARFIRAIFRGARISSSSAT